MATHRPLSSSCLGLPYRILNINHKKELLRGLWVYHGVPLWGSQGNCGDTSLQRKREVMAYISHVAERRSGLRA